MNASAVSDRPAVGEVQWAAALDGDATPVRVFLGAEHGWRELGDCLGATVIRQGGRFRVAIVYDAGSERSSP